MLQRIVLLTILTITFAIVFHQVESCNEAVCGIVVSKCLLTESCKCDFKNCTCCKECSACLGEYYHECCSCVDMCPKKNDTDDNNLSRESNVGELEKFPTLFQVLTDEPDAESRWTSFTFPIQSDIFFIQKKEIKLHMQSAEQEVAPIKPSNVTTVNCTVAFMSQCMSWSKCKSSCQSMGASTYRWFHDGCCECVGDTCINYGLNKSNCLKCPLSDDAASDDYALTEDDDSFDYGEGGDFEDETNDNENL